ncbi:patatin-like protein [Lentzea tibetensis]|nr:patatin-like protein [Lentzea tibetensis]
MAYGDSMPREEVRFAVVLNGGVSLAVWMGGVVLELDRLTRSDGLYADLLDLVGSTARADVIAGTSAGGINGAALALSQVNRSADLSRLRDLWAEQGRMEQLLRTPFQGQPVSLLKGDEFFLPRLQEALGRLTTDFDPTPPNERPIDLRITTTLLGGVPTVTYDDLGQPLTQSVHQGSFLFRRDPYDWAHPAQESRSRDDFTAEELDHRVRQLALAARSTASFPFAFEPSFIPVGGQSTPDRPDMADVASWANGEDRSRFAVDGGVLVNTPTREALEAIDRMPADGPVRRVMLLVFPHAAPPGTEPLAAMQAKGPTTISAGGRLLAAMSSQSGRTYVEKIEAHNRQAASSRGGRTALLDRLVADPGSVADELYALADKLYGHYEEMRIRQVARDVTTRRFTAEAGQSFERVRRSAEAAQRTWKQKYKSLPYVPDVRPPALLADMARPDAGWGWGIAMAERLGAAALDLLKRLVWVAPDGDAERICVARKQLHEVRADLRRLREELEETSNGKLDEDFWSRQLSMYTEQMLGPADRFVGRDVREQVNRIGRIVADAQLVLRGLDDRRLRMGGLCSWRALFAEEYTASEVAAGLGDAQLSSYLLTSAEIWQQVWLSRLLALEIAGTCLSDDPSTGFDQPVELVQVSLQTRNAFAEQSITADDKAGGASLSRFSGFLKRSWRVNDWIWGRLDGATMLCRLLFDPRRLKRIDMLGRPDDDPRSPAERAEETVAALAEKLFGSSVPAEVATCCADAVRELTEVYSAADEELEPTCNSLAELAAWGLHAKIICDELPRLRQAIIADRGDGSDARSRGELFLQEHAHLLQRLEFPSEHTVSLGIAALRAFDRAGIGREPLNQEASSDQMIRTAATAAAVAVTVADSGQSGLAAVRPVTRALRGAALLPYWTITGLTRGGKLAQFLGLLGFAIGGALVVMAMFGLLPNWATGPAAAFGGATLLAAFGYAALRSGTMLHGLVLLSPVIPLGVVAVERLQDQASRSQMITGTVTVGSIVLVVGALMVIGSLPAPIRTPLAVAADFRPGKYVRRYWRHVTALAVVAGLVWLTLAFRLHEQRWLVLLTTGLVIAFGVRAALAGGKSLQRWRREDGAWATERAEPPAAATAGWAVIYGIGFLLLAAAMLMFRPTGWGWSAAIGTAVVFGLVLLLVTSWLVPRRERRRIARQLVTEAIPAVYCTADTCEDVLRARLEGHALLYRFLVTGEGEHPARLTLTPAGHDVVRRIRQKLY